MASHGAISSARFRKSANSQASPRTRSEVSRSFCHFISSPADAQCFTLDGVRFDPLDPAHWQRAETLMSKLGHLIRYNPDPRKAQPNRNLPSGYTYFLQTIAHDLVHSSISTSLGDGLTSGLSNVRHLPLRLETVYGGGPMQCPYAYEASQVEFRNKLRLGNSRIDGADQDHQGPRKDIARATTSTVRELSGYAEALIADPRNDSHAIISQMLVLFHELHNYIVDELARSGSFDPTDNSFADAQRLFVAARTACILIYRNLIRRDLLPRILHKDVWEAYETSRQRPFPSLVNGEWRAPLEFTNGFFRFAHSMIRAAYRFNRDAPEAFPIDRILNRTSENSPSDVPLEAIWLVNWELFFGDDHAIGNVSTRIGPWSQVGIGEDVPGEGNLIVRDLLSSIAIRPWSVGHLIDRLRESHESLLEKSEFLSGLSNSGSRPWAPRIAEWLTKRSEETYGSEFKLSGKEIQALANDPPIPFFVRFEAGLDSGNGGERLGILGSIVVADVIYGVLEHDRLLAKDRVDGLQSELARLSATMLGDKVGRGNIFAFLSEIEDPDRGFNIASVRRFLDQRQATADDTSTQHDNRISAGGEKL
jgi:hypothetical protein